MKDIELTVLMPCLNEADTIRTCIEKAMRFFEENGVSGEVLISDNGSTDDSVKIATEAGARVVHTKQKGYGAALQNGIAAAKGKYIIQGDADDSYDFYPLMPFLEKLREGYDLVMGNRFKGGIMPGAMPTLHKYLGTPVLSFLSRLFFKSPIGDCNSGLRGYNREKIISLDLVTPGMEFASEMVVKASTYDYRICEVPIKLHPDGRLRKPHLNTWSDGWRHLVFLLIYSPKWLFFYPSIIIFLLSLIGLLALLPGTLSIKELKLDVHSLTTSGFAAVLSFQLFIFALIVRIYSIRQGIFPAKQKHLKFINAFSLARGIISGLILFVIGAVLFLMLFIDWYNTGFGPITDIAKSFRLLIPSLTLISLGVQTIFSSFVIMIINMNTAKKSI